MHPKTMTSAPEKQAFGKNRSPLRQLWLPVAAALVFALVWGLLSQQRKLDAQAVMTYAAVCPQQEDAVEKERQVTRAVGELLTGQPVLQRLRSSAGLASFSGTVWARQAGQSNLLTVFVRAEDAGQAMAAMQALTQILPEISGYLSSECEMRQLQAPQLTDLPQTQPAAAEILAAGGLGAGLMCLLLWGWHSRRRTLFTRRQAQAAADTRILTQVLQGKGFWFSAGDPDAGRVERINRCCIRLEQALAEGKRRFLITGAQAAEEASVFAAEVAAMMAAKGYPTVFLGRNRHNGGCYARLGRQTLPGQLRLRLRTPEDPPLTQEAMEKLLAQTQDACCVIVDAAATEDALLWARQTDAALLVVRQGKTTAFSAGSAAQQLKNTPTPLLGCVMARGGSGWNRRVLWRRK